MGTPLHGPYRNRIDGIYSGEDFTNRMLLVDDQPLELTRVARDDEIGHSLRWWIWHPDIVKVLDEEHEGTPVVFYY